MSPELRQLLAAVKTYEGLLVSGGILVRIEALRELAGQREELLAALKGMAEWQRGVQELVPTPLWARVCTALKNAGGE